MIARFFAANRARRLPIVAIILVLGASHATGLDLWGRLYGRAESLEDKLRIVEMASGNPTPELSPMLVTAIGELNAARGQQATTTDPLLFVDLSTRVAELLGLIGAVESSPALFDIVKNDGDARLRAAAILSLGRLGAVEYAGEISLILCNLNLNLGTADTMRDDEAVAFAAVLAIERMRAPVGFSPLFFASIGWYSPASGVREGAAVAMRSVVEDPTEVLFDIVLTESDTSVKLEALLAQHSSSAPAAGKMKVAEESLRQSLIRRPISIAEETVLGRMRMLSMQMIAEHGATGAALELLDRVMTGSSFDTNERITAIDAIRGSDSEGAGNLLVRFLKAQNQRQASGVTPADYRVIRATIQALGEVGGEAAIEELIAVGFSDWPQEIVREADQALEKRDP